MILPFILSNERPPRIEKKAGMRLAAIKPDQSDLGDNKQHGIEQQDISTLFVYLCKDVLYLSIDVHEVNL